MYQKFVFDGYDLKRFAVMKQQLLTTGTSDKKIPKIGMERVRPQSPDCMSREAGFDAASQTDDELSQVSPERRSF